MSSTQSRSQSFKKFFQGALCFLLLLLQIALFCYLQVIETKQYAWYLIGTALAFIYNGCVRYVNSKVLYAFVSPLQLLFGIYSAVRYGLVIVDNPTFKISFLIFGCIIQSTVLLIQGFLYIHMGKSKLSGIFFALALIGFSAYIGIRPNPNIWLQVAVYLLLLIAVYGLKTPDNEAEIGIVQVTTSIGGILCLIFAAFLNRGRLVGPCVVVFLMTLVVSVPLSFVLPTIECKRSHEHRGFARILSKIWAKIAIGIAGLVSYGPIVYSLFFGYVN